MPSRTEFRPCTEATAQNWLAIGIPTVPRAHGEDYLVQTLNSLTREMPMESSHPSYGRIVAFIVSMDGRDHPVFDHAKAIYTSSVYAKHLRFITDVNHTYDPLNGQRDHGSQNTPGWKVRKQTRDLVTLLRLVNGAAEYILLMEDDMQLCPYGLIASEYILARSSYYNPHWLAIRASFGMNGIFIHNADVQHLLQYLWEHQARRPPDHLIVEWYAGEQVSSRDSSTRAGETVQSAKYRGSRQHVGFRYNILHHIGKVSTLRLQTRAPEMPTCYDELLPPVVSDCL